MTTDQLDKRLTALERQVAELKEQFGPGNGIRRWWQEDAGRFANDVVFEEIVQLGRQYRQSLRPPSRKRKK